MHIDLNSCFATVEQQANPLLRGKPIIVAAYNTYYGAILSPSIEAKKLGIKMGMRVIDAKRICPEVITLTPDPPKYRMVHHQFKKLFEEYTPHVTPKSIDEAVLDFTSLSDLYPQGLISVGKEIKLRMRREIGEWISCNVGIGPNKFLAKTAASLHKPDGLDVIDHRNLETVYKSMKLIDLCGINVRYQTRLNRWGIYTPSQFMYTPILKLQKQVFQSIAGYYWYMRLRGWEVDQEEFGRKSFGHQLVLTKPTDDLSEVTKVLLTLCEKMGRRLRENNFTARGIHVSCLYTDQTYWHHGEVQTETMYTTHELFSAAQRIFKEKSTSSRPVSQDREIHSFARGDYFVVRKISVTCFDLQPNVSFQPSLFSDKKDKLYKVSQAMDAINDVYGEYVVKSGLLLGQKNRVLDRIAFGKGSI